MGEQPVPAQPTPVQQPMMQQPMMQQQQPMVIQQGPQPCFKCQGKGFSHDTSMTHKAAQGQKCFFCQDCTACSGSGQIAGGQTTITQGNAMMGQTSAVIHSGPQRCFKCSGNGFCHDSSMTHK